MFTATDLDKKKIINIHATEDELTYGGINQL